ncbi:hypothetical protein [Saccharomonospora sp.]|nr:hypothetical protein [Saccharomonospora sp.]
METFGQRLRRLRVEAGLSQSRLAGLPDDQQNAEWTVEYREALAEARALV